MPKMKTLVEMVVVWSPNMLNTQFLILVLLIISDERPYQCGTCDAKFKIKHHLKSHEKIHTGVY